MRREQDGYSSESLCGMSAETLRLYGALNEVNRQKVHRLIATLLDQQSSGLQSPGLPG